MANEARQDVDGTALEVSGAIAEHDDCCCDICTAGGCCCGTLNNTCTECFATDKTPEQIEITFSDIRDYTGGALISEFNTTFCLNRGSCSYSKGGVSYGGVNHSILANLDRCVTTCGVALNHRTCVTIKEEATNDYYYVASSAAGVTCATSGSSVFGSGSCGGPGGSGCGSHDDQLGYNGSHTISVPGC